MTGLVLAGVIFLSYALLIGRISIGWFRLKKFERIPGKPSTSVSIIIAARNEESNIAMLLSDMLHQDFPVNLMEILIVDDHSEDSTWQIVEDIRKSASVRIKLLQLKGTVKSGKKAAIEHGIFHATGKLIITTDADCRLPENWIAEIIACYESVHPKMILAPVQFSPADSIFTKIQAVEFISLMATTAGSAASGMPLLANGANLAYEREAFLESGGFRENIDFASGDDVFMLFRIKQQFGSKSIHFLKSAQAVVSTRPAATLPELVIQRLRWVSKSQGYRDKSILLASGIVYLANLSILICLFCGLFYPEAAMLSLLLYLGKGWIDFPVMAGMARFLKQQKLLWFFPLVELLNIFYTVLIGLFGNLVPYTWKGRVFSQKK